MAALRSMPAAVLAFCFTLLLSGLFVEALDRTYSRAEFQAPLKAPLLASYSAMERFWRLNRLPEVRRFLQDRVEMHVYEDVSVNYIHGKTPEFVLFNQAGSPVERIDVSHMTFSEIEALVEAKGFKAFGEDEAITMRSSEL